MKQVREGLTILGHTEGIGNKVLIILKMLSSTSIRTVFKIQSLHFISGLRIGRRRVHNSWTHGELAIKI